jgi:protease-4
MKKFLLGVLCGLVLAGMVLVILVFAAMRIGERRPAVADGSTLIWQLEGDVPERPQIELPFPWLESQAPLTVRETWSMLRRAATDSRIKALVFEPRGLSAGWGKLEEFRAGIMAFRKSGKPVYAFLRNPGTREYYVASAAERIFTAPEDFVDMKGMRIESMHFKDTLDKLGVKMEVIHAGKYKDAYDMFTRTSMTPETREVLNSILDQVYGNLCTVVAEGRKKTPEQVSALINQGPFLAADAKAAGLVDVLGYEDQVFGDLKKRLNQTSDIRKVPHRTYMRSFDPDEQRTRIALVVGDGVITRGSGDGTSATSEGIVSGAFIKLLQRAKSDGSIKGVIVRIDSPGGDAVASDDILHAVKDLSKSKPTVISMSDVAASGGYFIAATGDPIIAYPNTLTGSIGVITARVNLRGTYDKLGIKKDLLSRGQFAELDSDYAPLNDAARAKIRRSIEATYDGFLQRVADARHKTPAEIEPLAEGRVWLGAQANKNGLVDQLGGLDRAVEVIRQRAKIPATAAIALVPYPQRRSLLDIMLSRADDASALDLAVNAALKNVSGGRWIRSYLQGGLLKVMPYSIEIR